MIGEGEILDRSLDPSSNVVRLDARQDTRNRSRKKAGVGWHWMGKAHFLAHLSPTTKTRQVYFTVEFDRHI